ncbi:HD domain-containing protein [Candidatus Gottesmanbacteria bacterium]|nr:HD domain-containing protein [Candidatus Gottesmanbacteria bacterium]
MAKLDFKESIRSIIQFIAIAEKLKTELRHSWTSNPERQESVAEHTWMMCLLAITIFDRIKTPLNQLKCLKMIIIHDLGEAVIGDIPAFEKSERQVSKQENEALAMRQITEVLDDHLVGQEIVALWEEFEKGETNEAKFANAMDKVEVLLQHNVADIKTWGDGDFALNPYYRNELFDFDRFLRSFKDVVDTDTMLKIESGNLLHRVSEKHKKIWMTKKDNK